MSASHDLVRLGLLGRSDLFLFLERLLYVLENHYFCRELQRPIFLIVLVFSCLHQSIFLSMHFPLSKYQQLLLLLALDSTVVVGTTWSPIVVKNITDLGRQLTPDVTAVSRDGGYSTLIDGNIVWLYDDTECLDLDGRQHSFVSNTAAYAYQPGQNISTVTDFGVVETGEDSHGRTVKAILADTTVGSGGWIPFQRDELNFNKRKKGEERVAICECYTFQKVR